MTLKYNWKSNQLLNISLAQKSHYLIDQYFYLKHLPLFNQIQLLIKNTPVLFDTSKIDFEILISNSQNILNRALVHVIIHSDLVEVKYPVFAVPKKSAYVLNLDPSLIGILNNTSILDFDVVNTHNQIISYSILNNINIPFYLDSKSLRIIYPFPDYIDINKKNYLVF